MELSSSPVNPTPVLWVLSQFSKDEDNLINGEQQDIHEAFMVARQKFEDFRCPQVFYHFE